MVSASPRGQRPATLSVILEAALGARTRLRCEPQAARGGTWARAARGGAGPARPQRALPTTLGAAPRSAGTSAVPAPGRRV